MSPTRRIREQRPGVWLSAATGVAAAATSIAVATIVAVFGRAMRSPILDVGDRFIEVTPAWLKNLAISLFGTNDKLALIAGIGVVLVLFAGLVGFVAMRVQLWLGVAGIALFGVVGMVAALAGDRGPEAAVPSLAGATAGAFLLAWLHRLWFDADPENSTPQSQPRRRLLVGLGAAVVGAGLVGLGGVQLARRLDISSAVASGSLPPAGSPLPSVPAAAEFDIDGLSSFVTPNEDFYRIDTALTIPQIPEEEYLLRIHGMVDRELTLSYADLLDRAQVEADITMTCVSNEVGGRLVGNARWQGVRLDELLAEVGVQEGADQIVGRSYDQYTCGFPVSAATDGRDALVAVGMNGRPLPLEHGFPARLIVPGLYGYVSATKWLREIEITTFDSFDHYWVPRGWAAEAPIKTSSRIDAPSAFGEMPVGPGVIAGVAWAQTRGLERVEVKVDGGDWRTAELDAAVNDTTWRQWKLAWEVTPGRHDITVRATDGTGETQTEDRARPMPDGSTGWHTVVAMGVEQ